MDITDDQFDCVTNLVIVNDNLPWHDRLEVEDQYETDYRIFDRLTVSTITQSRWLIMDRRPVARLVAAEAYREPIAIGKLRALTDKMRMQTESAGDFMRGVRDDAAY